MKTELLPCPFCGFAPLVVYCGSNRERIMCNVCDFSMRQYDPRVIDQRDSAREKWNTRAERAERPADECECGHPVARHGLGNRIGKGGACFEPSEPGGHLCACKDYKPAAASAEQQAWVAVEDGPPDVAGYFLITTNTTSAGIVTIGYFNGVGFEIAGTNYEYNTIAWAHLPAPFTPQEAP